MTKSPKSQKSPKLHYLKISHLKKNLENFVSVGVALMLFMCWIAVLSNDLSKFIFADWRSQLDDKITIQVPPDLRLSSIQENEKIQLIKDAIIQQPGVTAVKQLSKTEIRNILKPLFNGNSQQLEFLPLPTIFDVSVESSLLQLDNLIPSLHHTDPDIIVDNHQDWLDNLIILARLSSLFSLFIVFIMMLAVALMLSLLTKTLISSNSLLIELLYTFGANDQFIIKSFVHVAVRTVLQGYAFCFPLIALLQLAINLLIDKQLSLSTLLALSQRLFILVVIMTLLLYFVSLSARKQVKLLLKNM